MLLLALAIAANGVSPALASGRGPAVALAPETLDLERGARGALWRSGSALANEAARYIGSAKFTSLPGAWCADAVSFWLTRVGKPPLPNRMAGSALAYGPRVANPQPGDLVVIRTRRGPEGHVGIVVAVRGDAVDIVSGNWGGRVARATISRAQVTAFVGT